MARSLIRALASALVLTLFLALAPAQADQSQPAPRPRPKLGLALSGGGARGLAHIGVIKVLEELGIKPDFIAGTSMGSIVGGLYAAGYTPAQMEEIVTRVDWEKAFSSQPERRLLRYDQKNEAQRYLFEVGVTTGSLELPAGLLSGYKLTALLTQHCLPVAHIQDFDRLPIPFRAVATDIITGDTVVLSKGNLAEAMRASMSLPSVFPPYELDGHLLVDGGVTQNLPVDTVKAMGADMVIAVNVSTPLRDRDHLKDFLDVMDQTLSLSMIASTKAQLKKADLVIEPELEGYTNSDFGKAAQLFDLGSQAAREKFTALSALALEHGLALASAPEPGLIPVSEVVVARVTMAGNPIYQSEVDRLAPYQPGQRVSVVEIDQSVQRIYGLGTFESVSYQVIPTGEGRSELRYILDEKRLGLGVTRMGLRVGINGQGSDNWEVYFGFRRPNLLYSGSEAELNFLAGRSYGVDAKLHLPNRPWEGLFLRPTLYSYSRLHDIYTNREMRAQFTVESTGLSLDAGYYLGTFGEFTLGYQLEYASANPRIMAIRFDEFGERLSGLRGGLRLDTLDRKPFPTRGFTSEIEGVRMLRDIWSELDYSRLIWRGAIAIPLADRHTIEPNWTLASSLNTSPARTQVMFLGGFPGLLGYAFEEFYGNELARLQMLYRWQLSNRVYLLLAGNIGQTWDSLDQADQQWDNLHWGGGGGVALDTPLGPLSLTLGLGEQGRSNLYFNFGYGF